MQPDLLCRGLSAVAAAVGPEGSEVIGDDDIVGRRILILPGLTVRGETR